ncbi:MAG: hypothetical protein AAEJ04_05750 [Planctomycetota bacterium]
MSSLAAWYGDSPYRLPLLLLLLGFALNGACSAQVPDAVVLEEVSLVLYGRERQEIAEVHLEGEQYRIQLFNPGLSTYYIVTIARSDLLSSSPIEAERTIQILRERERLIAARERLREERRKARREKALAAKVDPRKSGQGNKRTSSSRAAKPTSSSNRSISLKDPIPSRSSLEQGQDILHRLQQICEELIEKSDVLVRQGGICQESLRSWGAASVGSSRLYSRLHEECNSLMEQTDALVRRIHARMKEMDWTLSQIKSRDLRSRDVPEIADGIRRRVLQCEQKMDSLEAMFLACRDGLKALGDPNVESSSTSEIQIVKLVSREVVSGESSRPQPSTGSSDSKTIRTVASRPSRRKPENENAAAKVKKKEALVDPIPVDRKIVDQTEPEVVEETNPTTNPTTNTSESGTSTLLLGGVLGALLVLILSKVLKSLP